MDGEKRELCAIVKSSKGDKMDSSEHRVVHGGGRVGCLVYWVEKQRTFYGIARSLDEVVKGMGKDSKIAMCGIVKVIGFDTKRKGWDSNGDFVGYERLYI